MFSSNDVKSTLDNSKSEDSTKNFELSRVRIIERFDVYSKFIYNKFTYVIKTIQSIFDKKKSVGNSNLLKFLVKKCFDKLRNKQSTFYTTMTYLLKIVQ